MKPTDNGDGYSDDDDDDDDYYGGGGGDDHYDDCDTMAAVAIATVVFNCIIRLIIIKNSISIAATKPV